MRPVRVRYDLGMVCALLTGGWAAAMSTGCGVAANVKVELQREPQGLPILFRAAR